MAVVGVIAEYNPFHRGHAWQLAEIRRRLGDGTAVISCMSGNFVQRGDFAVFSKHARAEAALRCGADLVLELPTPWSAAAAERFAFGGAAILAACGVATHLAFGCECGSMEPLRTAADCLDSPRYHEKLRQFMDQGVTFAAARQNAVRSLAGDAADCLSQPNNILAVEYLRALKRLNSTIIPYPLPRTGADHDSLSDSAYPSASAIRQKIMGSDDWRAALPEAAAAVLLREMEAGRAPVHMDNCQRAVLARLRRMREEDFLPYDGGNEGLYRRFFAAVRKGGTPNDILAVAKTRRYPLARLRRMLLQSYLDVPQAGPDETPPYLRVLGANRRGRELLRQMRKTAVLPVISKPGHIRRLGENAQWLFDLEARCTDLYALAFPDLRQAVPDLEFTAAPVML